MQIVSLSYLVPSVGALQCTCRRIYEIINVSGCWDAHYRKLSHGLQSTEIFGESKLKLKILYLYLMRPAVCGICLSRNCPIIPIFEFTLNACPCVINQIITANQAEQEYNLDALDLQTLPRLHCVYKSNNVFQPIIYYYRCHCEYISGIVSNGKSIYVWDRYHYLTSIKLGKINPWLQVEYSKYLEFQRQFIFGGSEPVNSYHSVYSHDHVVVDVEAPLEEFISDNADTLDEVEPTSKRLSTDITPNVTNKEDSVAAFDKICCPIFSKLARNITQFIYTPEPLESFDKWMFYQQLQESSTQIDKIERKYQFKKALYQILNSKELVQQYWRLLTPCVKLYFETGSIDIEHIKNNTCELNRSLGHITERRDHYQIFKSGCKLTSLIVHLLNEIKSSRIVHAYILNCVKSTFPQFDTSKQDGLCHKILYQAISKRVESYNYQQDKANGDRHKLKFQEILEAGMQVKCPTISKKLIPLCSIENIRIQGVINDYINPIHSSCLRHENMCLEHAITEIVTLYRKHQSEIYLTTELQKYIPNFTKEVLQFSTTKQRFTSSVQIGSWQQIPMNAQRIYKEEYIRTILSGVNCDYVEDKLAFQSLQSISEFVCNPEPIGNEKQSVWKYLHSIIANEIVRKCREECALHQLNEFELSKVKISRPENLYTLVSLESIVSKWVYGSNSASILVSQLLEYSITNRRNESYMSLKQKLFNNPKFKGLFFDQHDAVELINSPEFRVIIQYF
ncbi:hypothetical protein HDV01_005579 [Terramyces sp. JEL0728]|nr:hypothetical protein HDV01_005579 [Terramyces sp. JEL0728]